MHGTQGTQTSMAVLVHQLMPMWYAFNVHVVCGYPLPIEALSQAKLVMKRVEIKTQKALEVPETSLKKDLSGHEQQQIIANLKRGFKGRDGGAKGLSNPEIWRC